MKKRIPVRKKDRRKSTHNERAKENLRLSEDRFRKVFHAGPAAISISTLGELPLDQVDMRTVLVIGCSRTVVLDRRMVTRRGYQDTAVPSVGRLEGAHERS